MARRINDLGLARIKQFEGLRLTAYRDSAGILTIGYGHTSDALYRVEPGATITEAKATELLRHDLREAEAAVERLVTVSLTDNQFAALVSFVFNVGAGAFAKSTLLKKLNAGDYAAVPAELAKWTKAGGRHLKGLANRRAAEAGLWATGEFVASNTVEPEPVTPAAATRPEAIAGYAAAIGTVLSAASDSQPLQWALAIAVVAAVAMGGFFFVRRMRRAAT